MRRADLSKIDTGRILFWLGAVSLLALIGFAVVPLQAIEAGPVLCPFKRFFGVECFGCGMTRAMSAMLHGKVQLALSYNRGVLLTLPMMFLSALALVRPHE